MQAHISATLDKQNSATAGVTQEPSHGGTATLVDNRPATVYQRKLQEAMTVQRSTTVPHTSRRTPQGSSRFQQIATAMGTSYGVDTSGLVATHNSSFPASLNAAATIQGHNIHFAPGMDTEHNIKHEVAHAIDNILHGTPKGDQVVQGQRVDTTREKVVDQMAGQPILQYCPRGRWDQERLARSEEKLDAKVVGSVTPRIAYGTVQNNLPSIPLPTPTPLVTPGLRRPASSYTLPIQCTDQGGIEEKLMKTFNETPASSQQNSKRNFKVPENIILARRIRDAVIKMSQAEVDHSDFPKALYNVVSEIRKLHNVPSPQPELKDISHTLSESNEGGRAEFNKSWTIYLRHYSKGNYTPLRSQAQLTNTPPRLPEEEEGTAARSSETKQQQGSKRHLGNTELKDWLTGNTGYIFALVCVGDKGSASRAVPGRGFLKETKYYKESKIQDYNYVWISSDANIPSQGKKQTPNIHGSGIAVRDALVDIILDNGRRKNIKSAAEGLKELEINFYDLEAKVTPKEIEDHSGDWQAVGGESSASRK